MYIFPSENLKLFGMKYFFMDIINLYNKKKMPNKILLSGRKGLGKSTLAYHLINCILSQNEDYKYNTDKFNINKENKSYKLVQNQTHPSFYLIDLMDEKKNIDIKQIRDMISYTNKSSFNNTPRFILIDNIENLNKNSVNALLKIIEEPNKGIYFMLINNNEKKILPTLKSRCLTFKINFTFDQSISVANNLLNKDISKMINHDLICHYSTPGEIINLINLASIKKIDLINCSLASLLDLLITSGYYKKDKNVKNIITNFVQLFFLKEYKISSTKNFMLAYYKSFLNKINNTEKFNMDEESLFLEFKSKLLNG